MSWPAFAQAVRPTARVVPRSPLLVIAGVLLLVAEVVRRLDDHEPGNLTTMAPLAVAALTAVSLDAGHDPADRLLAPLPVSVLARRSLRVMLVAVPAALVLVAVTTLLPRDPDLLLLPGLALTLSGLALATWLPPDRDSRLAVAVPVAWLFLDALVGGVDVVGPALGWWQTQPVAVSAVALGAIVVGSRRWP